MKRAKEEWKHDVVNDPEGHNDLYVCIALLYDLKCHGELYGRFDLDNKKVEGSLQVAVTYLMTPKVIVTFEVGLT